MDIWLGTWHTLLTTRRMVGPITHPRICWMYGWVPDTLVPTRCMVGPLAQPSNYWTYVLVPGTPWYVLRYIVEPLTAWYILDVCFGPWHTLVPTIHIVEPDNLVPSGCIVEPRQSGTYQMYGWAPDTPWYLLDVWLASWHTLVTNKESPASATLTCDKCNPTRPRPNPTSTREILFVRDSISSTPLHTILAAKVLLQKCTVGSSCNFRPRTVSSRCGDPITKVGCTGNWAVLHKYNKNITNERM